MSDVLWEEKKNRAEKEVPESMSGEGMLQSNRSDI
jgi:hypothetical protein